MNTSWTIHTKRYGALTLPGAIGDTIPNFASGREISVTLYAKDATNSSFQQLRQYAQYLNDSTTNTGTDIRGLPWFHETPHPNIDFYSTLVLVEPGVDVGELQNWWCVITNATVETNSVGNNPRLTLDLFALGRESVYTDRVDAEAEFMVSL